MNKKFSFFLLLCLNVAGFSVDSGHVGDYPYFYDNPHIDSEMQMLMAPHLLPLNHPIKRHLDRIFSQERVIADLESLRHAGFILIYSRPDKLITVARHPAIPGFVFKIYLDAEKRVRSNKPNWERLTKRCIGAKKIRDYIRRHNVRHFTVPDKWLYVLPTEPALESTHALPVILVATDMALKSKEKCAAAWKSRITSSHLDELYSILKKGYGTTALITNIPYTRQGTFAFVDTEYPERKHVLEKIKAYLSKSMQKYWDHLMHAEEMAEGTDRYWDIP